MAAESAPFLLVDGSSYLYRAFHALPALLTSHGEPTGAVYGMANMLRRAITDYRPEYMVVVFDAVGETFRDEMFAAYKANRAPMPDDLSQQVPLVHELIRALGIPLLEVPGVEADDVIGTLATQARLLGLRCVIATGDKDLAQLVDEQVSLVNTMDGSALDPAGVAAKFGVPPGLITDYLALIGDAVDNVPGVPKVGPKTAAKWLLQYGPLDQLIEHADEVKGKVGENLRASLEQLPLWRDLVTIRCDVPLTIGPCELRRKPQDRQSLSALYTRLEFKSLLAELLQEHDEHQSGNTELRDEVVLEEEQLQGWLDRLQAAELFAFDTETTSLDYIGAEIVGVSFGVEVGSAAYIPLAHDYPGAPRQLSRTHVLTLLRPLLEDEDKAKVGQNLKFDMSILAQYGIDLRGVRYDTMLESYVLDSTAGRHDLYSLALQHLGLRTTRFEDIAGKGLAQLPFNRVDLSQAAPYAAEDADVALRLHQVLWPRFFREPRLKWLFDEIEMPLLPVLSRMERNGVVIDAEMLAEQGAELAERIHELEVAAEALAGEPFNMGSPKQIQSILFDKLKLPVVARTPTGQPSTAESALQGLAQDFPLPKLLLEHRSLSKLKSTYVDALPNRIHPQTGRVHTSYHQAVASTGRLSSSDPNLQNIPIRTPEGRRIRRAFIAPPGYRLLAADYSQIELRIMAHLSADEGLRRAFVGGEDIHRATASEVFGVACEEVTGEQRRSAKTINFGLIYGMSPYGLARQLDITLAEAKAYVERYFDRYPGVRAFMDRTRDLAREKGYVETVFGRRLRVPDIRSQNTQRRQYAERTAINAPMQGTAADIIKLAMIRLDRWLRESATDARLIMQVHDELVLEVAEDAVTATSDAVVEHMTGVATLSVPLLVDVGIGRSWDEAH